MLPQFLCEGGLGPVGRVQGAARAASQTCSSCGPDALPGGRPDTPSSSSLLPPHAPAPRPAAPGPSSPQEPEGATRAGQTQQTQQGPREAERAAPVTEHRACTPLCSSGRPSVLLGGPAAGGTGGEGRRRWGQLSSLLPPLPRGWAAGHEVGNGRRGRGPGEGTGGGDNPIHLTPPQSGGLKQPAHQRKGGGVARQTRRRVVEGDRHPDGREREAERPRGRPRVG